MATSEIAETDATKRRDTVDHPEVSFDLVVVQGPDEGRHIELQPGVTARVLVGTSASCDLRLTDAMVSRRHAALEFVGLRLLVTDLSSTNGTYINDTQVVGGFVDGRDTLRVGSSVLRAVAKLSAARPTPVHTTFGRVVGQSPRMLSVFSLCERLATSEVTLVIEGDTGTGKEFLAEAVHEASGRSAMPFVVLDCRTTPASAMAKALFGEPAKADGSARPGLLELANGGTLLVDEPGDLDSESQAVLLKALDRGTVGPVDGATKLDVRLVVTSSRDLDKLVESGHFREDLYYRIAGARIELPPLRRRGGDVPLLANTFWTRCGGKGPVPPEFFERYASYEWPGNVRELERAVEQFAVLGATRSLLSDGSEGGSDDSFLSSMMPLQPETDMLTKVLDANLSFPEARRRVLEVFEKAYVERVLKENRGVIGRAAAASGIARRYFQMIRARSAR